MPRSSDPKLIVPFATEVNLLRRTEEHWKKKTRVITQVSSKLMNHIVCIEINSTSKNSRPQSKVNKTGLISGREGGQCAFIMKLGWAATFWKINGKLCKTEYLCRGLAEKSTKTTQLYLWVNTIIMSQTTQRSKEVK
uniref:Uncharacterized protein n=1 Tax=Gasterosteus aculeatus aculeatus TaxID=481459 RepID=A0AAQ4R616_GASAC